MQRFVSRHNIDHFRQLLAAETDPQQRAILQKLLQEEQAKLASGTSPDVSSDGPADSAGTDLGPQAP